MNRPIIGITSEILNVGLDFRPSYRIHILNEDYARLVERRGALPLILPVSQDLSLIDGYLDLCQGFLFTGGADINPISYGEEPSHDLGVTDYDRDVFELELMRKVIERDKPVLSICRGMQILNVARGGTLVQHIGDLEDSFNHSIEGNKYDPAHSVSFKEGSLFHEIYGDRAQVNSRHHQGIKELGQGLEVLAQADDGMVEALRLGTASYNYAVQWHPEEMVYRDARVDKLIDSFLDSCR